MGGQQIWQNSHAGGQRQSDAVVVQLHFHKCVRQRDHRKPGELSLWLPCGVAFIPLTRRYASLRSTRVCLRITVVSPLLLVALVCRSLTAAASILSYPQRDRSRQQALWSL